MELLHKDSTDKIITAFSNVYNELGFGFLEKVYQNGLIVCEYFADLIVNGCVIIELKAAETLVEEHELQLINYLKATEIEVGLLLNFGKKPQFKRKLFTNDKKEIESM